MFNTKTREFIHRRNDAETINAAVSISKSRPVYWFHAASLGEYAVIRPLIQDIKGAKDCTIVLTFFSTSGYNAMRHGHPDRRFIDQVLLLPIDARDNARKFVEAINPQAAVFSVSEIWVNYIEQLYGKRTPIYLLSAVIRSKSVYFHWYGHLHRHALTRFTNIFVLDDYSIKNLAKLKIRSGIKIGDALYNNAISTAETPYNDTIIENFCKKSSNGVFIAGSISDRKDLSLMSYLANNNRDTRFIFVPHEISEESLNDIKFHLDGCSILYSECTPGTDFSRYQVLIIDFIGSLAKIYRYCKWAYVGGGFGKYLHSVVEPAAYGIPTAYGPCTRRQITAQHFYQKGIGAIVRNKHELHKWFMGLKTNDHAYNILKQEIIRYTHSNKVSTDKVLNIILHET